MSLYLNVPFSEKDEAKSLGAKWNPTIKKWYIEDRENYWKFSKWILGNECETFILCDYFYIVDGMKKCFKCGRRTKVVAFAIEKYILVSDPSAFDEYVPPIEYVDGNIEICSFIPNLPSSIYTYLKDTYKYDLHFSKTTQTKEYSNICQYCGILQGNYFLHEEVDSPFFINSIEVASALNLHKITLPRDIISYPNISFGSDSYPLKEYSKIVNLNINYGF